ncbi:GNL3L/Grn1 putative GTPase-domain-containing protein [Irpex lacteus]|nr:GNL3L/Grn1 putative GTPase-domain-containing protein [Irpex lacteus]
MPRIRKKTSRRGTTNQREKIKHKAAETRKKRKKETKKNPQWNLKDPGIPNNFPYKDQILAEKEQKKALKAGAATAENAEDEASDGEGSDVVRAAGSSKQSKAAAVADADPEVEEEVNVVGSELGSLKEVLEEADVVVEVLDARDPLAYTEKEGQKLLFVLNKIVVSSWSAHLRSSHPTLLFRSASAFLPSSESTPSKGKGKARADDALGLDALLSLLGQWSQSIRRQALHSRRQLMINSLCENRTARDHARGGGKQIRIIDTPGYSWEHVPEQSAESIQAIRARDILVRNKGRVERLKDPEPVVHHIVSRATQEDLMLFYNLPAFAQNDAEAFSRALARASGLIKKAHLATLPTRKELRASTGLVKLKALDTDERQLTVEAKWAGDEDSEDDESEDEGEGRDEEDDESEDDEDEEPEPVMTKRKRGPVKDVDARPTKKVAFSAEPKNTKQARKAGSLLAKAKTDSAPAKSALKTATKVPKAKAQSTSKAAPVAKKAANAPSKKSAAPASGGGGGDEYDFGKFF